MIELYTSNTPNGFKISIMLEETGLPYEVRKIDLAKGEQRSPWFLKLNPNGKIPVIVDRETGQTIFESGAILIHLADKAGAFLAREPKARTEAIQWLFFQAANVGPMLGQLWHFRGLAHDVPYARERFARETRRIYGVADGRLARVPYLAGADYSIADIATWPWLRVHEALGVEIGEFPHVRDWLERIAGRPAVQRGIRVPA